MAFCKCKEWLAEEETWSAAAAAATIPEVVVM